MSRVCNEWRVRVYYEDTDAVGMVYHANYLKYMKRGRTEWLRSLGFNQSELKKNKNLVFVVVTTELNFKKPVKIDEEVIVHTLLDRIRGASLMLTQEVRDRENKIACLGFHLLGCVCADSYLPRRIPKNLLEVLSHVD